MLILTIKTLLSAILIVAIAELGKRSSFWGAALASLPLTSLLAMIWIYLDTRDTAQIAATASSIFWLVIPSLLLFLLLPLLLRAGWNFWLALLLVCVVAVGWAANQSHSDEEFHLQFPTTLEELRETPGYDPNLYNDTSHEMYKDDD